MPCNREAMKCNKMKTQILSRRILVFGWVGLVCAVGIGFSSPAFSQRYLEEAIPYRNSARIHTEEGFVEVHFTRHAYLGAAQPQDIYYSYYRDRIYATQGGYQGRPLHGMYTERYVDNSLKVLGQYRYGLKKGKWQYWDGNGVLRKASKWKEGKETGRFAMYTESGTLLQRGYLRDGKFEGIVSTYHPADSGGVEKHWYRNGLATDAEASGGWFVRTYARVKALFW